MVSKVGSDAKLKSSREKVVDNEAEPAEMVSLGAGLVEENVVSGRGIHGWIV
jgi:hypothetical protein